MNEWIEYDTTNESTYQALTHKQTNENQTETFTMSMCKSDANRKSLAMSS